MKVKEGILRKNDGYFPTYQRVRCVLHSDGIFEGYHPKTDELVTKINVKGCFVSRVQRRKRAVLTKESACTLSVYDDDAKLIIRLKADSHPEAGEWHQALTKVSFKDDSAKLAQMLNSSGEPINEAFELSEALARKVKLHKKLVWKTQEIFDGVHVMHEVKLTKLYLCMLVLATVDGTPPQILRLITEKEKEWNEGLESRRIIEKQSSNCHIEHVKRTKSNLGLLPVAPRDAVLKRYWGTLESGVCAVSEQSVFHKDVPEEEGYVREKIFMSGYIISPAKDGSNRSKVVHMIHMNPRGWLGRLPRAVLEGWMKKQMVQKILSLRESLDLEQFVEVDLDAVSSHFKKADPTVPTEAEINDMRRATSGPAKDTTQLDDFINKFSKGSMNPEQWSLTPLSESPFKLRGKNYLKDKVKIECDDSAFMLVAVDLFETQSKVSHIASRPDSIVNCFDHDFTLILNFQVPGPPFLSFVCYFVAKEEALDLKTPMGRLLQHFLTGTDEFRDGTFKIIPRAIAPSPWVVQHAVGSTPAILGKKLKQTYFGNGESYFEIDIDVGSSRVAGGILGMVKGYASTLTLDLAFLLEGQTEEELPESLIGAVRLMNPNINEAKTLI